MHANGHDHASAVVVEGVRFLGKYCSGRGKEERAEQTQGGRKRPHLNHDGRSPNKGGAAGKREEAITAIEA